MSRWRVRGVDNITGTFEVAAVADRIGLEGATIRRRRAFAQASWPGSVTKGT
jgi:hypothetical protein